MVEEANREAPAPDAISFDDNGLVPCVVQDWQTGEVLTLAFMNAEALERTRETGETHFYSRSRDELWHKGESSGNVQRVRALRYDCDADAILALVEPAGPACHNGERSCFHQGQLDLAPHEALPVLERTIADRRASHPAERLSDRVTARRDRSYTADLLADPPWIADKVLEESEELARAALDESPERVAEEAADVLYHVAVLLASRDMSLPDAFRVINERRTSPRQ